MILVCLATLPATLFTFYLAQSEKDATIRRSEAEGKYILSIISREHVNQINSAKTLLRWLAYKLDGGGGATQLRDKTYLAGLLAGYPQLANIAIVDPNGDVAVSAYPVDIPINMANYEAIRRALQSTEPESGVYVIGPIVKRPLLHLAQSVRGKNGKILGVVFVALDLEYLNRLFKQAQLPEGHVVYVADRDGNILASSGTPTKEFKASDALMVPMEGLPGLRIASAIPYGKIREEANETFLRIVLILSTLTLFTVASVILLEEVALLRYLRMLGRASRRFGEGDFSVRLKMPKNYGELERMANAFNSMAAMLEERHKQLVDAHNQLNNLTRHLQIARESERLQVSRDLHDEVGQVLTSIKMDLSGFENYCRHQPPLRCKSNIDHIRDKIDHAVGFIRRIASTLRPPVLDEMGLTKALHLLARNTERNTDLVINVDTTADCAFDWLTSTTIYRIVQESLTNVVRHAKASEVNIRVSTTDDTIEVTVSDDGVGLAGLDTTRRSLGIVGMRERAKMMSGTFSITDNGNGTTVEARLPRKQTAEFYAYPIG